MSIEGESSVVAIFLVSAIAGSLLLAMSVVRPRLLVYAIFAIAPTQFIFIPVSTFFVSPADALVMIGAFGLSIRLAAGKRHSWRSLDHHLFLVMLVGSYALGLLILGHFSRTLIRVPLAIVPSVLACEALKTRAHLARAAAALVVAGAIDAAYGAFYYANGVWLHPTRFSGMMGGNFSAIVIVTAAVVAYALVARTRRPLRLAPAAALTVFGIATLSRMGIFAFLAVWIGILRKIVSTVNLARLTAVAIVVAAVTLAQPRARELIAERTEPNVQLDGVARTSEDVRMLILTAAARSFVSSPLIGIGYGAFQGYSTSDPVIASSTGGAGYGTHNTYLEILVEGGLPALLFFLLHFAQYLQSARTVWRAIAGAHDPIVAAAVVGLPVVLISAAVANVLLQYNFWNVCGLALACQEILRTGSHMASPHRSTTLNATG